MQVGAIGVAGGKESFRQQPDIRERLGRGDFENQSDMITNVFPTLQLHKRKVNFDTTTPLYR